MAPMVEKRWVTSAVFAPMRAAALAASQPAWPPPITMTSNESPCAIMARLLSRSGECRKKEVVAEPHPVSRETSSPYRPRLSLFHVKQPTSLTEGILLPHAKFPGDHVENVLDIDPAKQPPQRVGRRPKFLGGEFLALPYHLKATEQRSDRLLQQFALPRPADQSALARAEISLSETDKARYQFRDALPPASRDPEHGQSIRPRLVGQWPTGAEIDLVAHQPDRRSTPVRNLLSQRIGEPQHQIRLRRTRPGATH